MFMLSPFFLSLFLVSWHGAHPGIIDSSNSCDWTLQDEKGGEIGGIRGDHYHGETAPDDAQHSSTDASGSTYDEGMNTRMMIILQKESVSLLCFTSYYSEMTNHRIKIKMVGLVLKA